MEAGRKPAALLVSPETCTLFAFRREVSGGNSRSSNGIVAVLARWSVGSGGELEVLGKAAVQLKLDPDDEFDQDSFLVSAFEVPDRHYCTLYTAVISCAVLDALLDNKLPPADTKAALTSPEECPLSFFVGRYHDCTRGKLVQIMDWALDSISRL